MGRWLRHRPGWNHHG